MNTGKSLAMLASLIGGGLLLTGCGGGGSSPTPPPPAQAVSISGTAATGLAMANATVQAKCAGANGTTTTGVDGSYTLTVAGASMPCALRVVSASGSQKLHSLAIDSGNVTVANITPLTELVVTRAARQDAAAFFDAYSGSGRVVTMGDLRTAQTEVTAYLNGTVDTSMVPDFIHASLKAALPNSPSNDVYDHALDRLGERVSTTGFSMLSSALASGGAAPSLAQLNDISKDEALAALSEKARSKITADFLNKIFNQTPNEFIVDYVSEAQPVYSLPELKIAYAKTKKMVSSALDSNDYVVIQEYDALPTNYVRIQSRRTLVGLLNNDGVKSVHENSVNTSTGTLGPVVTLRILDLAVVKDGGYPAENLVIRDAQAWAALIARLDLRGTDTQVDFGNSMVLGLLLGDKNTHPCSHIQFSGAFSQSDKLLVTYTEEFFSDNVFCIAAGKKVQFALVPKSSLPVNFVLKTH